MKNLNLNLPLLFDEMVKKTLTGEMHYEEVAKNLRKQSMLSTKNQNFLTKMKID